MKSVYSKNSNDMKNLWDKYEAAILLDKLIDVLEGRISRRLAVKYISKKLREYAINKGLVIDEIYRNINGISLQMSHIEYIYTNGLSSNNRKSKLFQEIVDLYKNDREKYEAILKEAKEKIETTHSLQDEFFAWLSKKVSSAQLSDYYISYADIDQFCLQENILDKKLFETTDLNVVNNLIDIIGSNKKFKTVYKHSQSKLSSVLKFYCAFLKERPNSTSSENILEISNRNGSDLVNNVDKNENIVVERSAISIDEVKSNRKSFIAWLTSKGINSMTALNYTFSIKSLNDIIKGNKIDDTDLLLITDVEKLKNIKDILTVSNLFGEKQKKRLLTAFNELIEFRQSVSSINENISKYEKYAEILNEYFSDNGYKPGSAIHYNKFKNYFHSKYGDYPLESNDQITEILQKIGTQIDDRIFPKQDEIQNKLIEEIVNDIVSAFDEGASAVYNEAVYEKYKNQLADNLKIYSVEALTPLLVSNSKGKFLQKNSYFKIKGRVSDSVEDILRVMQESHQPLSYDDIHKKLWYIPYNKMKSLLYQEKSIVWVAAETYFYAPNLPIDETELKQIISLIQSEVDFHSYLTGDKLMELIKEKYPIIAMNLEGFSNYGVRNCLGYILSDYFAFKGAIISKFGEELNTGEVYAEFAKEHDKLSLQELKDFAAEINNGMIYWDSVLGEMVRISQSQFVRKDLIDFDVDAIDDILDGMCPRDYIPLREINLFLSFPNIGYNWNSYVIESYLYSFSRKFTLVHASFSENDVYGAMVRKDSLISDYRSLIVDVLSHSDSLSSEGKALQFIVDQGYQQKKSNKEIGSIIKEAKLIKEKREKQEK